MSAVLPPGPDNRLHTKRDRTMVPPKRARTKGAPYTPGMFDALLPPREFARPDELRGVTIEVAASGRSVICAEHMRNGAPDRRHILTLDQSSSLFIHLPNGDDIWIEVTRSRPVPGVFDEPEPERCAGPDDDDDGAPEPDPEDMVHASPDVRSVVPLRACSFIRPAS